MKQKRIYLFIGTTAELIKLAPVIRELTKRKKQFRIITSGQNNVNFDELSYFTGPISAFYAFSQRPIRVPLHPMISFLLWTAKAFYNYLLYFGHELKGRTREDTYFIVHGDTVSSLLGALIAKWFGVSLVHIESGLRSFNFFEPFPEEASRYVVSKLADIHFCPNAWSLNNLRGVRGEKINTRQNTLIESCWSSLAVPSKNMFVRKVRNARKPYCVFVMHRQEHVIFGKKEAGNLLLYTLKRVPGRMRCVFLVHDLSVDFVDAVGRILPKSVSRSIVKTRRLPYVDFMHLLAGAEFIVTDGGSNQEEMYYMGKPCLLLRNNTERIEGLGKNVVLSKSDMGSIRRFLAHYVQYKRPTVRVARRPSSIIVDRLSI